MKGRAYVLIFFFWAFLTVITPTLVRWSETSKPGLRSDGKKSGGIPPRKMIRYAEAHLGHMEQRLEQEVLGLEKEEEAPSPSPDQEVKHVQRAGNETVQSFLERRRNQSTSKQISSNSLNQN